MPRKTSPSRGLQDRIKLTEVLHEVFGAMSPEIAARHAELLEPDLLPGETMPDTGLEHTLYLRLLDRRLAAAKKAEQLYRLAKIELAALNRQSDPETSALYDQLGALRKMADLALGKGASADLLRIRGRIPRRPDGVCEQAASVLSCLGGLEPTTSRQAGVSADPEQWRKMIEPGYRRLAAIRKQVAVQQKRVDRYLRAKDEAFDAFDDTARGLVRIAEGQCRLVGRLDLAKRVRRFSRKRKRPGPKPRKKTAQTARTAQESEDAPSMDPEPEEPPPQRPRTPRVA